ncbi:hypothetical protein DFH06DRAFT_605930 [Mycena polygramma]|nr:hypothetical protein DFH06DRAFT_605930 [Mycena polygramma]
MDPQVTTQQAHPEPRVSQPTGRTDSVVALSPAICLKVPPEIWGLVATLSSRSSIVHLCAVSHRFYSIFSPLLYRMTCDPPLTVVQSSLLMRTIRAALKPHPALLIRSLSINRSSRSYKVNNLYCREAIEQLVDISSPSCRGAMLRALEWNSPAGIDELGALLRTPGYFPNLKKISVRSEGRNAGFEFLHCPYLEEIECSLILGDDCAAYYACGDDAAYYETWRPLWDAMGEALKLIPLYSPLLHTLKLKIFSRPFRGSGSPPWDAYHRLITAINHTHFPALSSLRLSVNSRFTPYGPEADFSPLLVAHPLLVNVTLRVGRLRILADSPLAHLPGLRSFNGSIENAAVICSRAPEVASISLKMASDYDDESDDPPTDIFPPNGGPAVTFLEYRTPEEERYYCELSVDSVSSLASAFPNIKRLDIRICEDVSRYCASLASLLCLEYLCIRYDKVVDYRDWKDPQVATITFPAATCAAVVNDSLLPFLPHLSDVHLLFLGQRWIDPDSTGCDSCDEFARQTAPSLPSVMLEYRLHVNGGNGEAEAEFVDCCDLEDHGDYRITYPDEP